MKVQITSYDAGQDQFFYDVTFTKGEGESDRLRQFIDATALSDCVKDERDGVKLNAETMLLVLIFNEYFKDEPHDLIGHEASRYIVPAGFLYRDEPTRIKLRGQPVGDGFVPLNSNNVKHLKLRGSDE